FGLAGRRGIADPIAIDHTALCVAFIIESHDLAIRQPHHIADAHLASPAGIRATDHYRRKSTQIKHLILIHGDIEARVPPEAGGLHGYTREQHFDPLVRDPADVPDGLIIPGSRAHGDIYDVVHRSLVIHGHVEAQPAMQKL